MANDTPRTADDSPTTGADVGSPFETVLTVPNSQTDGTQHAMGREPLPGTSVVQRIQHSLYREAHVWNLYSGDLCLHFDIKDARIVDQITRLPRADREALVEPNGSVDVQWQTTYCQTDGNLHQMVKIELMLDGKVHKSSFPDWRGEAGSLRILSMRAHAGEDFVLSVFGGNLRNAPEKMDGAVLAVETAAREQGTPLSEHFEKLPAGPLQIKPKGIPMVDSPATKHWVEDEKTRKAFWADAHDITAAADIETAFQEKFIHDALLVEHVKDFLGAPEDGLERVTRAAVKALLLPLVSAEHGVSPADVQKALGGLPFAKALDEYGYVGTVSKVKLYAAFPRTADGQPADREELAWVTVAEWYAQAPEDRFDATYNGKPVMRVRRDNTYPDRELYVIDLGDHGVGSKTPDTRLDLRPVGRKDAPAAPDTANDPPEREQAAPSPDLTAKNERTDRVYNYQPLAVWPTDRGCTIYKGVRFSVTLYAPDATWDDAVRLMEQFVTHPDNIHPSCRVQPAAAQPPVASAAPPARQDAPPSATQPPAVQSGDKPAKSETGFAIARNVNNGKLSYAIFFNLNTGGESKYPLNVSGRACDQLELKLEQAGFTPEKWEAGKRYTLAVKATWVQGKETEVGSGKFYKDFTGFEVIKEVATESVPL